MGLIIKLLVLIVAAGVAAKYGLFDLLQTEVRQVAQTTGASPAEVEKLTDFSSYLSISRLYELVGSLPPPFGSWGKLDTSKNLWPMGRQADSILIC